MSNKLIIYFYRKKHNHRYYYYIRESDIDDEPIFCIHELGYTIYKAEDHGVIEHFGMPLVTFLEIQVLKKLESLFNYKFEIL